MVQNFFKEKDKILEKEKEENGFIVIEYDENFDNINFQSSYKNSFMILINVFFITIKSKEFQILFFKNFIKLFIENKTIVDGLSNILFTLSCIDLKIFTK